MSAVLKSVRLHLQCTNKFERKKVGHFSSRKKAGKVAPLHVRLTWLGGCCFFLIVLILNLDDCLKFLLNL